ncbi:diaminopimelate epimerase [Eubacterium infirmum F0142]|nr:diaminopimelate epimerase [Eubacterium infirmum F0142]
MKFWKMNGTGNDFLIIDNSLLKITQKDLPFLAKTICERHHSIGADGLMIVEKASEGSGADLKMSFFNNDGSTSEMCGNGARCICRYAYENGLAGEEQRIETEAGIVTGRRISESDYNIRLNTPCNIRLDENIEFEGKTLSCSYIELGDPGIPHLVVEIEGLKRFDEEELYRIGAYLRSHKNYPKGANVNFYEKLSDDHYYEKTFERGVEGFTLACGTGTGSLVSILTIKGEASGKDVKVDMKGGRLTVNAVLENGKIKELYLRGATNAVCRGEVKDEKLKELIKNFEL